MPYLEYQPLAPGCSDDAMTEFFRREEEPAWGMCPAHPEQFKLPLPLTAVSARAATE